MTAPAMDHLSIHFMPEQQGGHTWVAVFAGKDADHRAKCGDLAFRNEEWELLADYLHQINDGATEASIVCFEIDPTKEV
jgi:hypothetical protein